VSGVQCFYIRMSAEESLQRNSFVCGIYSGEMVCVFMPIYISVFIHFLLKFEINVSVVTSAKAA